MQGHGTGTKGILDDLDGAGATDGEGVSETEPIATAASLVRYCAKPGDVGLKSKDALHLRPRRVCGSAGGTPGDFRRADPVHEAGRRLVSRLHHALCSAFFSSGARGLRKCPSPVEALPSVAAGPTERWWTDMARICVSQDGWAIQALAQCLQHPWGRSAVVGSGLGLQGSGVSSVECPLRTRVSSASRSTTEGTSPRNTG